MTSSDLIKIECEGQSPEQASESLRLAGLSLEQRVCFVLWRGQGWTIRQIALLTGLDDAAVRVHIEAADSLLTVFHRAQTAERCVA